MQISEIVNVVANGFFGGDIVLAGIVFYIVTLGIVFALFRNMMISLVLALPITIVFNSLGMISQEVMIILIVVTVLALAMMARKTYSDV